MNSFTALLITPPMLDYTWLRRAWLCRDMTQGRGFAAWPAALPHRARLCRDIVCHTVAGTQRVRTYHD